MLVPFSLEMDALPVEDSADAGVLNQHVNLIKLWHQFGILILARDPDAREYLRKIIEHMPQRFKTRWQKALTTCRRSDGPSNWQGIKMLRELAELEPLKQSIDVFYLDPVTAQTVLNMDPKEPLCQHGSLEICRFDTCNMSNVFGAAADNAEKPIFDNEDITAVWQQRFQSAAEISREIVIVDRYACNKPDDIQGLRQLFINIDRDCNAAHVTIYAGFSREHGPNRSGLDLFDQIYKIKNEMARGGVNSCTLYCVEDYDFKKLSHQRFLRFDSIIFSIDVGVSLFSNTKGRVYRTCAFSVKHCLDDYRRIEIALKGKKVYDGSGDV